MKENILLAQLERHHNLTFLEYKPLSAHMSSPFSDAGIVAFATKVSLQMRSSRPSFKTPVSYMGGLNDV